MLEYRDIFYDPSPDIQYLLGIYSNITIFFRIGGNSFAAMIKTACKVVGFVGDGTDDFQIGGGGIQHYKGVVGGVGVAFVYGFSKSGEAAVGVERIRFADVDGGIFGVCRAFRHKNHVAICIFCIQFRNDVGDAVRR